MKTIRILSVNLLLVMMILSGCASVPKASPQQNEAAKVAHPNATTAFLYIYRSSFFGAAHAPPVSVNGRMIGQLPYNGFYLVELKQRKNVITVVGASERSINLSVDPGKTYYLSVNATFGFWAPNWNISVESLESGQAAVDSSDLIKRLTVRQPASQP